MKIDGEIAIVTGGASGLGKCYAIHLLERKAKVNQVHVWTRNPDYITRVIRNATAECGVTDCTISQFNLTSTTAYLVSHSLKLVSF